MTVKLPTWFDLSEDERSRMAAVFGSFGININASDEKFKPEQDMRDQNVYFHSKFESEMNAMEMYTLSMVAIERYLERLTNASDRR